MDSQKAFICPPLPLVPQHLYWFCVEGFHPVISAHYCGHTLFFGQRSDHSARLSSTWRKSTFYVREKKGSSPTNKHIYWQCNSCLTDTHTHTAECWERSKVRWESSGWWFNVYKELLKNRPQWQTDRQRGQVAMSEENIFVLRQHNKMNYCCHNTTRTEHLQRKFSLEYKKDFFKASMLYGDFYILRWLHGITAQREVKV